MRVGLVTLGFIGFSICKDVSSDHDNTLESHNHVSGLSGHFHVIDSKSIGFHHYDEPMVLSTQMKWAKNSLNFTLDHIIKKVSHEIKNNCDILRYRPFSKDVCLMDKTEHYYWGEGHQVSEPVHCEENATCIVNATSSMYIGTEVTSRTPLSPKFFINFMKRTHVPVNITRAGYSDPNFSIKFSGPGRKVLNFKPLLWQANTTFRFTELIEKSLNSSKTNYHTYYEEIQGYLPIRLDNSYIDGVFYLEDA